ncbi:MAG: site-specific integrase [Microbacterium sp.]|nr:site-specific integrase [Microbacterium sp.]
MSKRVNGEGSIRQRANGRWEARLTYKDDDDSLKSLSYYGGSKKEAKAKLDAARKRLEAGDPANDATMTVGQWCETWMSVSLEASSRKPTTKDTARRILRGHVQEATIGRVPLAMLKASHFDKWLLELRARTKTVEVDGEPVEVRALKDSTIQKSFRTLSVALDGAVRDKLLARNPAKQVEVPTFEPHEARVLTPEQTTAILHAAKTMDETRARLGGIQSRNFPMLAFIAATAVRKGEALALKWDDIDFDAGTVTIRGTLSRVGSALIVTSPKTRNSRRVLAPAEGVMRLLRAHRTTQLEDRMRAGNLWQETGHVFTTVTGRPVDPSAALRAFKTAAKHAGIEGANVHTLRHSAATAMLDAGTNLPAVSKLLGHSKTQVTGDIYAHLTTQTHQRAMDELGAALGL